MSGSKITVVVPVYNSASTLYECLSAIFKSNYPPYEVVVVDDCSTDESLQIAGNFPCRIIKLKANSGAAIARNRGVESATGDIISFLDSDVIIPENALSIISETFEQKSDISGVIGLLSNKIRYRNLCSRYKNSYMHYTYMKLPENVAVFYTSTASIKKDVFENCGGFDENYKSASIEDLEFGQRIANNGYMLYLNKDLQVEHIRYYSFKGLLKTGIIRTAGIIKIRLRAREKGTVRKNNNRTNYVTSPRSFMLGIVLTYLSLGFLIIGVLTKILSIFVSAFALYLSILVSNLGFLNFLRKSYGNLFFVKSCLLIFSDMLAHGLGGFVGIISYIRGNKY